ncbi:hypothetical protein C6502_00995 [Candidatus Poribacteria bacterium]|nr:MAG: hypothetical protein C6502_00995 [Candidatus Poribacteria bacterium]
MERREKRKWQKIVDNREESTIRLSKPPCFQFLSRFLQDVPYALRLVLRASRFTPHVLSLTILTLNLILPTGELGAQTDPASTAEEAVSDEQTEASSETTPTEDPPAPEVPNEGESPPEPPEETSETPSATDSPTPEESTQASRKLDPENMSPEEGDLLAKGDNLTFHDNLIQIHGNGLIKYDEVVLYADHIWADFDENVMRAAGNVHLLVGNEETYANELLFNIETKKGIIREGFSFSDPWYYRGTEIFKTEDDESYIRGGALTTCSLKHPHYYFSASKIIVRINKELIATNIVLRVGGVPLFYFPAYRRDLRQEDKVAKVIVKVGTSSYQGVFLSVILPLARRFRYDGALLFDHSARRGSGLGADGKYRVNDFKFQEIVVPLPPNATPSDRTKLEEKAQELADRLEGEYDLYKLRQLFLEYQISEEDITAAQEKAENIHAKLQEANADFAATAQADSTHQDTRYQGGDMGFLVRGERDEEDELRLDPILEEAVFQLKPGEITPILRTESGFHILKVDRVLDVYGQQEFQIRRIDVAIEPSEETRNAIRSTAEEIQARAEAGEVLEELAGQYEGVELSEANEGAGFLLNEMDRRWKHSVSRLEAPGAITWPIYTDQGVYILELIEKEPTPTFEEIARQFEAEWAMMEEQFGKDATTEENEIEQMEEGTKEQNDNEINGDEERMEEESEIGVQEDSAQNSLNPDQIGDDETVDPSEEPEKVQIYQKYDYRGRWEVPTIIYTQGQRLYGGEHSGILKGSKAYRLIKIDKKRTYRGDFYFYTNDEFSFDRRKPFKTGRRWNMRWGHRHTFYTPWDSRAKGRRPASFVGRVAWRAKDFEEEGFGIEESALNSFGVFTWGTAYSALDREDRDEEGNLRFSSKTIGEFLGRFQVNHTLNLTDEGTTTLQKLPALELSLSRMRLDRLPVFESINSRLTKVAEALHTDLPILSMFAIPTLESTSFDLDVDLGNFFRERFRDEENIYLQTMDLGFDLRKQSVLQIIPNRELRLDMDFDTNLIWHDKDREGNQNIFRGIYGTRLSASNLLFRIYDISYIPGARRMRHQINSRVTFDYSPPVEREDAPPLYPFGPSVYFFERKNLSYNFDTSIEVKTRGSRSALRVLQFYTRIAADFTKFEALGERRYVPIESRMTIVPLASRALNITFRSTHDPNESRLDGKRFKQVGFRSNVSYRRDKWNVTVGNAFTKRTQYASRSLTGSFRFRPSHLLELNLSVNYDWIEKQFYSQSIMLRRNLHNWNMTIRWHRIGIKRDPPYDNVRQDFTFQINLIAEPAASVGVGYDATTDTWGFRSLPAGVPYDSFGVGNSLGRSYF